MNRTMQIQSNPLLIVWDFGPQLFDNFELIEYIFTYFIHVGRALSRKVEGAVAHPSRQTTLNSLPRISHFSKFNLCKFVCLKKLDECKINHLRSKIKTVK